MFPLRRLRLSITISALLALTLHVLAMGGMRIAHAAALQPPAGAVLCAAHADAADAPAATPGGQPVKPSHGDCPFCSSHGAAAPAMASATSRLEPPAPLQLPPLFVDAPDPVFAWAASRTRGPPARS